MAILRRGTGARQAEKPGEAATEAKPGDAPTERKPSEVTAEQPATPATVPAPPTAERAAARSGEGTIVERLDGMRGWLGDLDRTVGVRSRIGLFLAAIAIGAAGAAIYLALNAKQESATNRDVSALQDRVSSLQDDLKNTSDDLTALRGSVNAARSQSSSRPRSSPRPIR